MFQSAFLPKFQCLADKCEDTCCKGWNMQLDDPTFETYQTHAPELLDAVEAYDDIHIMRRDEKTDFCVKFDNGLCGIHASKGSDFLGDACHFFPRSTRKIGDMLTMTAVPSCPEVVRLALLQEGGLTWEEMEETRLPNTMRTYGMEGISDGDAFAIHNHFLEALQNTDHPTERILLHIYSVVSSLEKLDKNSWGQAIPFYMKNADARLRPAESRMEDAFNLFHAFAGLIVATRKPRLERLQHVLDTMQQALEITLDWDTLAIETSSKSMAAWQNMWKSWQENHAQAHDAVLRRWLILQLKMGAFPFAGLGHSLCDKVVLLGVRLATIRLSMMCMQSTHNTRMPDDAIVRAIQPIARIMDHLADADYSLQIYTETGWTQEARLRGLLEPI